MFLEKLIFAMLQTCKCAKTRHYNDKLETNWPLHSFKVPAQLSLLLTEWSKIGLVSPRYNEWNPNQNLYLFSNRKVSLLPQITYITPKSVNYCIFNRECSIKGYKMNQRCRKAKTRQQQQEERYTYSIFTLRIHFFAFFPKGLFKGDWTCSAVLTHFRIRKLSFHFTKPTSSQCFLVTFLLPKKSGNGKSHSGYFFTYIPKGRIP